jgi:hypothetical protein
VPVRTIYGEAHRTNGLEGPFQNVSKLFDNHMRRKGASTSLWLGYYASLGMYPFIGTSCSSNWRRPTGDREPAAPPPQSDTRRLRDVLQGLGEDRNSLLCAQQARYGAWIASRTSTADGIRTMSASTINSNHCGTTCLRCRRATVDGTRTTEEEYPLKPVSGGGWVLLYSASVITPGTCTG